MLGRRGRVRIHLFIQYVVQENLERMSKVFQMLVLLRQPQRLARSVRAQVKAQDIGQEEMGLYITSVLIPTVARQNGRAGSYPDRESEEREVDIPALDEIWLHTEHDALWEKDREGIEVDGNGNRGGQLS